MMGGESRQRRRVPSPSTSICASAVFSSDVADGASDRGPGVRGRAAAAVAFGHAIGLEHSRAYFDPFIDKLQGLARLMQSAAKGPTAPLPS